MTPDQIAERILSLGNITRLDQEGTSFFFVGDDQRLPLATILTNSAHDSYSNLDREGVFRLNISLTKEDFRSLGFQEEPRDFTALDTILPHPEYGMMHYICILNPSRESFTRLQPMLAASYQKKLAKQ